MRDAAVNTPTQVILGNGDERAKYAFCAATGCTVPFTSSSEYVSSNENVGFFFKEPCLRRDALVEKSLLSLRTIDCQLSGDIPLGHITSQDW